MTIYQPVACASLASAAVKVQHSGIGQAVESELDNVGMLESVTGTVVGKGVSQVTAHSAFGS